MVRVSGGSFWAWCSAYKHLILSVSLIYGLRHRRDEDFEATTEARHNCRQLSRRLYHLRLNEIGRQRHLCVRPVDRAADERDFVASLNGRIADQRFQLANLGFNDRQRLGKCCVAVDR